MKLLVEFDEKNYVVKAETLNSVDELMTHIKNGLNNAPTRFDVQYYDEDFKTYVQLTSIEEIKNMSKLRVEEVPVTMQTYADTTKRKMLSPSSSRKKSPSPVYVEKLPKLKDFISDEFILNGILGKIKQIIPPSSNEDEICCYIYHAISAARESCDKNSNIDLREISNGVPRSQVVEKVAQKYPFLNTNLGRAAVDVVVKQASKSFKQKLPSSEDLRAGTKRKRQDETSNVKRRTLQDSKVLLAAGCLPNFLPDRRKGQTDSEIEKLKNFMMREITADTPQFDKVSQALNHTLSDRRHYIVSEEHTVDERHRCYPWLFTEKELIREFSRICNEDMMMKDKIFAYFCRVSSYVQRLAKDQRSSKIMLHLPNRTNTNLENKAAKEVTFNMSLIGIPSLLDEDLCNLFVKETKTCSTVSRISIHYSGIDAYYDCGPYTLCVDGRHITLTSRRRALCAAVAAHYAFNIGYCRQLFNFFTFIESEIFRLKTVRGAPPIVTQMIRDFKSELDKDIAAGKSSGNRSKCPSKMK